MLRFCHRDSYVEKAYFDHLNLLVWLTPVCFTKLQVEHFQESGPKYREPNNAIRGAHRGV